MTVAVLYARRDSIYKTLPDCDVWDADRDALQYRGPWPVVAHPPCRAWGSLKYWSKHPPGEKELARHAVSMVRKYGGVLEHPHRSDLFREIAPNLDETREFIIVVDQNWFGHRAQKRTRLYISGCSPRDLPPMPLKLGEATHTVGKWSGRDKHRQKPEITKREKEATPVEFARWLVEVARICGHIQPRVSDPVLGQVVHHAFQNTGRSTGVAATLGTPAR